MAKQNQTKALPKNRVDPPKSGWFKKRVFFGEFELSGKVWKLTGKDCPASKETTYSFFHFISLSAICTTCKRGNLGEIGLLLGYHVLSPPTLRFQLKISGPIWQNTMVRFGYVLMFDWQMEVSSMARKTLHLEIEDYIIAL
ncbi:hypothetical protein SUGI_0482700 [Cryptomeria japonica]|nr:hypothetical protein SUGI_0482700 [Cryptomeria japonica]